MPRIALTEEAATETVLQKIAVAFLFAGIIPGGLLEKAGADEQSIANSPNIFSIPVIAPNHRVVNVAGEGFGNSIGGGDYGLANVVPVEVSRGVGRPGKEIHIFRTPRELRLSQRGKASFQLRVGKVDALYFWMESPSVDGGWQAEIATIHFDGYREQIFSEDILREGLYYIRVRPGTLLEFRLSSAEKRRKLAKRFVFTVSPVEVTLWKDTFRRTPYTYQRGQVDP